jgi:tartrate dehydrogenase/decarboxylase/D-malate dehydrogenase
MRKYNIAVIPGDGIGEEIMPEGIKVLRTVAEITAEFQLEFEDFPWGSNYFLSNGKMMPDDGLRILESFDAIYFGAVGFPTVPDQISLRGLRLLICQGFDQYANVRPSTLLPGITSPLRDKGPEDIDFVVVRENTEGEYSGAGGRAHKGHQNEVAVGTTIFTRIGVERIIRFAFELAQKRLRRNLLSATKSNAQEHHFSLWDEVFEEVSSDYPDVTTERVLIDALAARFVLHPESLDVIVASNLFADILTDLGGAISGSLGVAPSGNLNPEREYPSMFEPIHGSAPDIYGKKIANPIGMIWSGAMMLEFLGEEQASNLILSSIKEVTKNGDVLTPDLGGSATTSDVGDAIAARLVKFAN